MKFASQYNKKEIALEKQKIIFQFLLITLSAFIAGILFIKILSDESLANILDSITRHFNTDFSADNFGSMLFRQCVPDIICIALLYVFSFSFINYIVSDLTLAFLGFRFGICAYLSVLASLSFVMTVIFIFLRVIILGIILIYCCNISMQSLHLKKIHSNGRVSIDTKVFISITLSAVSTIGATLIIYGLYCLL
ncbi:MAG: hypothetical protein IJX57_00755 [Clostridia bacterium]|nr:hypothetical protein [Clostridia bacterium]